MRRAFEQDQAFVLQALEGGTMDYLEVVGKVAEMEFFRKLLGEGVLQRLAASYPTPRRKEEVPLWLYLASEITLRLHGAMGFGAYPYIVHCGGLLDALGPEQVEQKEVKPGVSRPVCRGYNRKNHTARTTPCDADYLRKLGKDTQAEALEHWFGTAVAREYQTLGGYDPEGVFLVDGTYLFVPLENDRYERSSRLLFGEDGHPISKEDYEALPVEARRRCHLERCYRAVTLSHTTAEKDYALRCGVHVMPGRDAESPQVWPLVERFVDAVGPGVMKLLIYDRGLVDGETVGRLKAVGADSLFPLKKGMDVWEDAKMLAAYQRGPWVRYDLPPPAPVPPPPDRPEVVRRREAKRQETLRKKREEAGPEPPVHQLEWIEHCWIEPSRLWKTCPVPISVLLVRNHYADGQTLEWALGSTRVFAEPWEMWNHYALRPAIEEEHRQEKCFWDMSHFRSTSFSLVVNQVVFVELASSLIQLFLRNLGREEWIGRMRKRLLELLLPNEYKIIVYFQQRFGLFSIHEYEEILLTLREGARRRLLGKVRQLRRAQCTPPDLPWRTE